ncbi:MAG: sulfatase-like hydrolase/transferase, partial [Planctomycetota bacterium]
PSDYDPVYGRYVTDAFGDEAVSFIDAHHADPNPFFLYLPFTAPHTPLQAKEQDLIQFPELSGDTQIRAAMTLAMDRAIGKVLDALLSHGIDDNTIVVFTNDNGGKSPSDNSPFRGYKAQTWEGGIRVPFVLRDPGLPGGVDYDRPVSVLDLTPTLLAAAGGDIPTTDGVDLAPYLTGQMQGDPHETLFWRFTSKWAVRDGDWKLVESDEGVPMQLFDLASDPGETNDLAGLYGSVVDDLLRKLTLWETGLDKPRWGKDGADNRNLFDHFLFRLQSDFGMWSSQGAWFEAGTALVARMLPEDAYANAILEFPVAGDSYEAHNDMTRMTGQTFMLNEIRCTGDFAGTLDATGSFTFELQTDFLLVDDLEITGDGTQPLVLSGTIEQYVPGRSIIKTGASNVTLTGPCWLSGDLHVDGGRLTLNASAGDLDTVTVGPLVATLQVAGPAIVIADTVDVIAEGALEGGGTVQGTTDSNGTIRPGSPVGTLTVDGSLTTTGTLEIEVANADPGGFDAMVVTGNATIGGTLAVTLLDGYVAQIGDTFEILTAQAVSGAFSATALPDLSPLLGWDVVQDADSVTLLVIKLGDIDGDGSVNIDDFLAMLAAWGPCPAPPDPCPADLDGDGSVGITDFLILLANWG